MLGLKPWRVFSWRVLLVLLVTTLAEIKPTSHQFICFTQRKLTFSSLIETVFLIIKTFEAMEIFYCTI